MKTVYFLLFVFGALMAAAGCGRTEPYPVPVAPTVTPTVQHRPTCAVEMIAPVSLVGSNFYGAGTLDDCTESDWNGILELRMAIGQVFLSLDIDRSQNAPGDAIDLTSGRVALWDRVCTDWTGTVTWQTDEPDWSILINATCIDDPTHQLVGKWWGHVYNGNN